MSSMDKGLERLTSLEKVLAQVGTAAVTKSGGQPDSPMKTDDLLDGLVKDFQLNEVTGASNNLDMPILTTVDPAQVDGGTGSISTHSPQSLLQSPTEDAGGGGGVGQVVTSIDYPEGDLVFQLIQDVQEPTNTQDSRRRTPAAELPSSAGAKDEDKIDVGLFLTPAIPQQQQQLSDSKTSPAASLGTSPINSLSPATPASATAARHRSKEGEAIMAGLTGFGSANLGHHSPVPPQQHGGMGDQMGGGHHSPHHQQHPGVHPQHSQGGFTHQDKMPFVKIIEQPAENKLRFRYECEGRSAGALHGVYHTNENKTYPTIQVVGYKGPAVVVVSCVEDKPPYRTHPHNLVGKDGMCKKGVCSVDFNNPEMTVAFQNLGIQCVKRRDAPGSLARREQIQVDPFKQGFKHKNTSINLNCIRLCFQVFLKTDEGLFPLAPVVSNIIRDKKSHSDLQILDYSDDTSPVEGGKKILLFCEKVYKDDIEVHFTLFTKGGEPVTCKGDFSVNDVHKQYGISLKTPAYPNKALGAPVKVSMYLYKPSDRSSSEPVDFWYMPSASSQQQQRRHHHSQPSGQYAGHHQHGSPTHVAHHQHHQQPQQHGVGQQDGTPKHQPSAGGKRGRERPANRGNDDPSSGMVNVPPKMGTDRMRGGGVVNGRHQIPPSGHHEYQNPQGYGAVTGGVLFTDMVIDAHAQQQQQQQEMHHAANARGSQGGGMVGYNHPQPPTQARPVKLESPTGADSPHPPPPPGSAGQGRNNVNDFGQGQQGAGGGGGNGGQQPILNTSELIISGMSLTNLDVNTGDLENLSSNLGTNLKLEGAGHHRVADGGGGVEGGSTSRRGSKPGHPSSNQLDTPDVSLNLEDASAKKNNLNR